MILQRREGRALWLALHLACNGAQNPRCECCEHLTTSCQAGLLSSSPCARMDGAAHGEPHQPQTSLTVVERSQGEHNMAISIMFSCVESSLLVCAWHCSNAPGENAIHAVGANYTPLLACSPFLHVSNHGFGATTQEPAGAKLWLERCQCCSGHGAPDRASGTRAGSTDEAAKPVPHS